MTDKLTFPPLITLEEHFLSTVSLTTPAADSYTEQFKALPDAKSRLTDLDTIRLESMNENKITLQVISHAPTQPPLDPDQCREANTQLHIAICKSAEHRSRFAAFAVLPMSNPDAASQELAHCIENFGFVGALIDNHAEGKTYETPEYRSFWYTVQALGVPIYLHPTWSTDQQRRGIFPDITSSRSTEFKGTEILTSGAVDSLMASSWSWHSDVALHVFKLFAAGVFDRYPRLKIVVGHFGEMIPFMLARIEMLSKRWGERKRSFREVYDENLWITVSGVWSLDPLATILRNTKKERILFSVDYPFARNEWGKKWMEELCESGMCNQKTVDMIGYLNAEKLLGVRVRREGEKTAAEQEEEDREDANEL